MSDLPFALVVALPFAGCALVILSKAFGSKSAPYIAVSTGIATALTAIASTPKVHGGQAAFGLVVDGLGFFVALTSSVLGALILIYSLGYMGRAKNLSRYYALVLLTIGCLNGLVLSGNALVMACFWTACSFLTCAIVRFNKTGAEARFCAKKAQAFGLSGDMLLFLGIVLLRFGSDAGGFDIAELLGAVGSQVPIESTLTKVGAFAVLVASMIRSAQVPLHVWLPDAMEAPSSGSALLDAATVMNAGVYVVMRFYPALRYVPGWASAVTWTGAFTIVISALMALYAVDIKKMLAFSTMSQLGYMFFAVGTGSVLGAQFHLMSHAIFKTLLFLAAGSLIHATGTRDMNKLSGAGAKMPVTAASFLIGVMGLAGVPFMSGFFSKDMILAGALAGHQYAALALAGFGAVVTVVYSFSAYLKVFKGEPSPVVRRTHEAPLSMEIPMAILSILTPFAWLSIGVETHGLHGSVPGIGVHEISPLYLVEETFGSAAFLISLVALTVGLVIVRRRSQVFAWLDAHAKGLVAACKEGFYFDRLFALPEQRASRHRRPYGRK